jgi:hypothetical protein
MRTILYNGLALSIRGMLMMLGNRYAQNLGFEGGKLDF